MRKSAILTIGLIFGISAVSAQGDFEEILGILLNEEEMQEILVADREGAVGEVCLITPEHMKSPSGKVNDEWIIRESKGSTTASECLELLTFDVRGRKAKAFLQHAGFKVKLKARRDSMDTWHRTSLTIRGNGKFMMDKTI